MKNFNDFFAIVYLLFFLVWLVFLAVMLVNLPLSTIEAVGLGTVTGGLLTLLALIVQYYFRKSPPKGE
ncbi:hypothetical protein LCGC14_2272670 [marine sediment metagenome]|uniref:Uncharacterized protein n=1 Tax=marine sediment metagenome TaxID=412755 RepID=A0A0F9F910_9ZZZZ